MWNICFNRIENSNCYQLLLLAVARHFKRPYNTIKLNSYYPQYFAPDIQTLKNSIAERYYLDFTTAYNRFCRIGIEFYRRVGELTALLKTELNNAPVGIFADPFDCYWTTMYQKVHYSHAMLITGIDSENEHYLCRDIYYPQLGEIRLTGDELSSLQKSLFTFIIGEPKTITAEQKIGFLKNMFEAISDSEIETEQCAINNYFLHRFSIRDEIGDTADIKSSILLLNLLWIAEDKAAFASALLELNTVLKKGVFDSVAEMVLYSRDLFGTLRAVLLKSAVADTINPQSTLKIINEIYETDRCIINEMRELLKNMEGTSL
jgi:hypothetical protein